MTEARRLDAQLLPVGPGESFVASEPSCPDLGAGAGRPPKGWSVRSLLFVWVFPLLRRTAETGRMEPVDLFNLAPEAYPEPQYALFVGEWRRSLQAAGPGVRSRRRGRLLLKVLGRVHFPTMWLLWIGRFVQAVLDFSFPYMLNRMVKFVEDDTSSTWAGLALAVVFLLAQFARTVLDNNVSMGMQSVSLRIRSSMITAIFRKVLILRQDALLGFSSGRLNNMITTDVDKAKKAVRFIHILVTAPLKVLIAIFSLYRIVGVAVFIGLTWMAVLILLNPVMMYFANRMEDKQQSKTDERVRKATETISSIQVVKCYAWEEPAKAKVEEARREELLAMWRLYSLWTVVEGLWSSVVPITTAVMFASYSLLNPHDPLTAAQAFTAIALMGMVQEPLFSIPWVLNLVVEALVAAKRLERLFFLKEAHLPATAFIGSFSELDDPADLPLGEGSPLAAAGAHPGPVDAAIRFQGESFEWPRSRRSSAGSPTGGGGGAEANDDDFPDDEPTAGHSASPGSGEGGSDFQLANLVLQVPNGALVAVVGPTASGKTSLLQAILGEMPVALDSAGPASQPVSRTKPIAFCPQQPWVFNATVRQNILFGEAFSERRYAECLRCCDLDKDLERLTAGDQTKVGEKGISLSGGQKARVCLARASYRQGSSNLFILDDPYSALDAHVARKVHEEAVLGLLKGKTRIVATNRLEFAAGADIVIVLDGGRIQAVGPYDEVRQGSPTLRSLLEAQGLDTEGESPKAPDVGAPGAPPVFVRALSGKSEGSGGEEHAAEADTGGAQDEEEEARATGQLKKEVLELALPVWMAHWTASRVEAEELPFYLTVYVLLSAFSVIFALLRSQAGNVISFRAARRMHAAMFASVLRAPMSFFQDTPQGRIINRFSKDMNEIDTQLIWQLIYTIVPVLSAVGSFALVGGTAYFALIAFLPAFWLYYQCWKFYNRAALDLKRISKVVSSPVYDHFNNLCRENAVCIVRAHGQVERQCRMNNDLIIEQQRPEYSQIYVEQWFCLCIQTLGCMLVFMVAVFAALGRGRLISASAAALALTFAGNCSESVQSLIGNIAEFGMAFNCVERVMEYATTLPAEAPLVTNRRPPSGWPNAGVLVVKDLRLRYRPTLPLVLQGISFVTQAGERIGVVGRTGAGKSSLLLALLRIAEPEPGSTILLDGEDILALGLKDLRSGVAMIPQEPVLFQESLRYNCDPYGHHSAEQVWAALEEAQLAPWVRERSEGASRTGTGTSPSMADSASSTGGSIMVPLQTLPNAPLAEMLSLEIKEGGQNLSVGQRQMVAIARAVLRKSRLVVLDEATAAIDAATDAAIQLAVRRCFHGATTLTIAHRLQTIMDSDRVLVLAEGKVSELGSPEELRARENGVFRGILEEAGQ